MLALALAVYVLSVMKVPYTTNQIFYDEVPVSYQIVSPLQVISVDQWFGLVKTFQAQVSLENNDTVSGTYQINFIVGNNGNFETEQVTKILTPGEVETFSTEVSSTNVTANLIRSYKEIPYTKEVTEQVSLWDFYLKGLSAKAG